MSVKSSVVLAWGCLSLGCIPTGGRGLAQVGGAPALPRTWSCAATPVEVAFEQYKRDHHGMPATACALQFESTIISVDAKADPIAVYIRWTPQCEDEMAKKYLDGGRYKYAVDRKTCTAKPWVYDY